MGRVGLGLSLYVADLGRVTGHSLSQTPSADSDILTSNNWVASSRVNVSRSGRVTGSKFMTKTKSGYSPALDIKKEIERHSLECVPPAGPLISKILTVNQTPGEKNTIRWDPHILCDSGVAWL